MIRKRERRSIGFSLIEVLIALLIFMIAGIGLTQLIAGSILTSGNTSQNTAAVFLAHQKIEQFRNTPYASLASGQDVDGTGHPLSMGPNGNPPGSFQRSWTVLTDQPIAGTKTITVTVSWQDSRGTETYSISTIIGQPFNVSSG